ncbi:MAG: AAA family ATPase [Gemmatimonadota bacterium]|nr:AAA family ATPase [Gemmatimonadota bacterium]
MTDRTRAEHDLSVARRLTEAGVPLFLAAPDGAGGWHLPMGWEQTPVDAAAVDRWRPGMALCAVMGHVLDVLDVDPRNGGMDGLTTLQNAGEWPEHLGVVSTPSGGEHYWLPVLGQRKGKAAAGVDYQGGAPDGRGRGFVFLPPTVARSKVDGQGRRYAWITDPRLDALASRAPGAAAVKLAARLAERDVARPGGVPAAVVDDDPLCDPGGIVAAGEGAVLAHVRQLAEQLADAPEGEGNDTAARLAYMAGQYVGAGQLDAHEARDALMAGVGGWSWRRPEDARGMRDTVTAQIRAGARNPRAWTEVVTANHGITDDVTASVIPPVTAPMWLRPLTYADLAARPRPRPLIRRVLNLDSDAWLIGASGTGKSFLALDWALHVATGRPWDGRQVRQGRTLYVAGEGVSGLCQRIDAWAGEHGESIPDDFLVVDRAIQAGDPEQWGALIALVREIEPVLIVLDTQARMTLGMEENSNSDMSRFVEQVSRLRRSCGACVLVVHHTGRSGGDARGASAIDGAQDMEWTVERLNDGPDGLRRVRLTCSKSKDGQDGEALILDMPKVDLGVDAEAGPLSSLVIRVQGPWTPATEEAPKVDLPAVQREAYDVLRNIAPSDGVTMAELNKMINEKRKERAGEGKKFRELPRATLTEAVAGVGGKVSKDGQGGLVSTGLLARNGTKYADADRFEKWRESHAS